MENNINEVLIQRAKNYCIDNNLDINEINMRNDTYQYADISTEYNKKETLAAVQKFHRHLINELSNLSNKGIVTVRYSLRDIFCIFDNDENFYIPSLLNFDKEVVRNYFHDNGINMYSYRKDNKDMYLFTLLDEQ